MKYLFSRVTLGTLSVCVLIFLFAVLAIFSADRIAKQSVQMFQHPYTVKSAAQAMRTRLMEMRMYLLPTILSAEKIKSEYTYKMLDERDHLQDESIAIIRKYYLGDPADVTELEKTLAAVRQDRRQAVLDCAEIKSIQGIMEYTQKHIYPHSEAVNAVLQRIMDTADRRVKEFREVAESARDIMIWGATLLCLMLITLVIFTSINERRKNKDIAYRERLFKLFSKSIADVFLIYDHANGQLEYVSENSFSLLGITPQEFYQDSMAIKRGLTPETAAELEALLDDDNLTDSTERNVVFQRDNYALDLKLRIYPITATNKKRRFIVMLSDQTQAIAQQATLNDALLCARKANEAKQEFLSRMSHEIRTPMNAIVGMTTIAAKYLGDKDRVTDCLDKIAISSKHLLSLINDVLDIAKIERGKLSFAHGQFNFRDFIKTLTAIVYPQTIARHQNFEVTISGLNEEALIGDELRLNQVLINLLSNALKFTPPDGDIRLDITCLQHDGARVMLRFAVRDSGIGMSEEFLARLYKPFEQAEDIAQHYGGTGLGLSITKNLVYLMSGNINVESEKGKGTTFTIELPFDLPEQKKVAPSPELGDINVLVADDDLTTCEHAMLLLEQIGVRGDWANSGMEALKKVTEAQETGQDYTVCFIDWRMPGMDGVETARKLRQKVGADTPIIIISSYDWAVIEQEAREAGVNGFIAKPFFTSSLYNALVGTLQPESIASYQAQQNEQYDFKGKKVLLAEDNPINQEIALEILQSSGLRVDCANDGRQALDMFLNSKAGEYALILMDVQMPHMDGYETTRAIRTSDHPGAKSVPILAMTADAFVSDIRAAEKAGMNGHLAKPIDVTILLRTISEYLDQA